MRVTRQMVGLIAVALISTTLVSLSSESKPGQPAEDVQAGNSASVVPVRRGPVREAVNRLVKKVGGWGGRVGVVVMDAETGMTIASHGAKRPLNPASNMKLVTAATALWKLGPKFRYRTGLYGAIKGDHVARIVLRSYGDPSLGAKDLWELASGLRRRGIKRIDGDVLVDQSFFDDKFIPPGFEQQPNEWAYFRAPVCAVPLERNTVTMTVFPTKGGQNARVVFVPEGFVDVTGTVKTIEDGAAQSVRLRLKQKAGRLNALVGGKLPADSRTLRFTKRVDDPRLYAGYVLAALLRRQGIEVKGTVRLGGRKVRRLISLHRSAALPVLLRRLGKNSDNFYAEMLFKGVAAGKKRRGLSSEDGARLVESYLDSIGAKDKGTVIRNGSGLFDTNRVTTHTLAMVLRDMIRNVEVRDEYVQQLSIAGVDGTLHGRMRNSSTRGRVRAKTGTLSSVASLSGYVMAPGGRQPVVFSIVVNKIPGKVAGARLAMDRCVRAIAREVWRGSKR